MKELREQLINLEVQFQSDYEDLRAAYEKRGQIWCGR